MRNLKLNEPNDDKNVHLLKVGAFDGLLATVIPKKKYSRTPLVRTLVIHIGLALLVNLSIILQKLACLEITGYKTKYSTVLWLLEQISRGRKV